MQLTVTSRLLKVVEGQCLVVGSSLTSVGRDLVQLRRSAVDCTLDTLLIGT